MNCLVLGGFLGSGKTSVLLPLIERLAGGSEEIRVAVIENEIGEIAIDTSVLDKSGVRYSEIAAGCICCTLQADLVSGIKEVMDAYDPAWVVVEATGMAYPDRAADLVRTYIKEAKVKVISLVDLSRWEELYDVLGPLMAGQVRGADMILANKADLASAEERRLVFSDLDEINPAIPHFEVSAKEGIGQEVYTAIESLFA